jgi:hypothetical protein
MTLKDKIQQAANEAIPFFVETIRAWRDRSTFREYCFMYECDGVFDVITYDREENTFKVEYSVGVGEGMLALNADTAYYDAVEKRTLVLNGEDFGL